MGPLALLLMHTASATSHVEGVDPAPIPQMGRASGCAPSTKLFRTRLPSRATSRASGIAKRGKTGP